MGSGFRVKRFRVKIGVLMAKMCEVFNPER
jgi:hypothetical protein